ncbi:IclR family transcriptional regulator [Comamonas thiooxydans]|uniref:IclR family transcriptional regulator n=1 Tax=Comamonas thiooxydans TaxID=363952 RepID=UPI0009B92EC4|nr:helix-turn-helix domain-containing protein [Comamonas thiooxydans]
MAESVKSAQRVLELIEFFAEWRRPASVKEICQTLGYPQSSTSVLMKSLKESGYFDHDARTGMYVPNVRLALATGWIQAELFSEQSLLRLMERVLAACGHTVMIGAQHGIHLRYLHVLQATREERFLARSGSLRPLFRSAGGKLLLTLCTEREIAQLLRRANAMEDQPEHRRELPQIQLELHQTKLNGWSISEGTSMPGAAALAILLPVPRGRAPMSLCIGGPMKEICENRDYLLGILSSAVDGFRRSVLAQTS